jgi:hypothetical protein
MKNVRGWGRCKYPSSGSFKIDLAYSFGDCGLNSWPELDPKMSYCRGGAESLVLEILCQVRGAIDVPS